MGLIYGAFCLALGIAMSVNFLIKSPDKKGKLDPTVIPWVFIGIAYFIMFVIMAIFNEAPTIAIYGFQIMSTIGLLWFGKNLEYRYNLIPKIVYIAIGLFVTAWTVMSYVSGMDRFSAILPSVFTMAVISMLFSIYFFIRSEEEVLLKTILGILFLLAVVVKIAYLTEININNPIIYIGLFVIDYMLYLITSFLIFFNNHYRKFNRVSKETLLLRDAIDQTEVGIAIISDEGVLKYVNKFINDLILTDNSTIEMNVNHLMSAISRSSKSTAHHSWIEIRQTLDQEGSFGQGYSIQMDKISQQMCLSIMPIDSPKLGSQEYLLMMQQSIKPLGDLYQQEVITFVDEITGLPSKKDMAFLLEEKLMHGYRDIFALLVIHIANYEEIVEGLGEEMVEEYMSVMTSYIKEVDHIEFVGKISPDTFEIITKNLKSIEIQEITNDLLMNMTVPFIYKKSETVSQITMGVAMYPNDGMSHGALLKCAQIALGKASYHTHEQVQYYDVAYMTLMKDKRGIEEKLKNALLNEEFYMVYQPQYDAKNKTFRGFEALLRWRNVDIEKISPNLFIPMAEDLGIINDIGDWVLKHAIEKAIHWQIKYNKRFIMSVNVSGLQLEQVGFAKRLQEIMTSYNYPPSLLELEITETRLIRSSQEVFQELRAIKDIGVKIALDDFGTGYSSLDYLRWLPFDVLKIDKSFIDNLNDDSIEKEIVHSVITLVNKMNLETVAEGVENAQQLKSLQDSSCTYIQGYLFSKPLSDLDAELILSQY